MIISIGVNNESSYIAKDRYEQRINDWKKNCSHLIQTSKITINIIACFMEISKIVYIYKLLF